jgi:DNA polymerase elongation subunit (family B)
MSKKPTILYFDLEFYCHKNYYGQMAANDGLILSFGYKFEGERKPSVLKLTDYKNFKKDRRDDSALVQHSLDIIASADVLVGFFSKKCDIKYLNTRAAKHGFDYPQSTPHIDLHQTAKAKFSMGSTRLDEVARLLGLPGKTKGMNFPHDWQTVLMANDKEARAAMDKIANYNKQDIEVTQAVYKKLRPIIKGHPNIGAAIDAGKPLCVGCGSNHVVKVGARMTATKGMSQRWRCQDCGTYQCLPAKGDRFVGV